MCGIAGIISQEANKEDARESMMARLQRMTTSIQHRGPDGTAYWVNPSDSTGFGHCRLSIIDLSPAAAQPMHLGDSERYSIVHNGEIYNYIELKAELAAKGYSFRNQSDTEMILASYDCWKEECVEHFDGMFAFAIWDEKEKTLFAARDRFGEKPFFYVFDEQQLVFSSEMKALWAAGVERKPNYRMLFNFITIGYTGNPEQPGETFFENIQKLPPATTLKYTAGSDELLLEKYWDLDPEQQDESISDQDAIHRFRELLTQSVKRRLRSDVPVGTSLSGGLDSSSIVALMCESGNGASFGSASPKAFTAVFPGFERDEYSFSKAVADRYKLNHHTVTVTANDLLKDWQQFSRQQEEPVGSASAFAQYKVFELAQQQGVKVLLDGQGADETIAGYHKYFKWYWQELFHRRKLYASKELRAARTNGVKEKFGFRNIIASLFPDLASVILERQYLLHALRQEDLNPDFVKSQSKEAYYTTPALFSLNGVLFFNTCVQGLEELLRYADRNAMAHGREPRLPFLSHELVEFVFRLPSHFKIREGWTKWILRKAMNDALPDTAWRKEKVGFEPPQAAWMQTKQLGEMIHAARNKMVDEKILSPEVLQKPLRTLDSYAADNYDWRYLSAASCFYDVI